MLNTSKNLRLFTQIFSIDENAIGIAPASNGGEMIQIFKYEQHEFFENFFSAYNPMNNSDAFLYGKDFTL